MSFRVDNVTVVLDVYGSEGGRREIRLEYKPADESDPLVVLALERVREQAAAELKARGAGDLFLG